LYAKRYLRITVPLAAAILFTVTFLYHVSNGPLWSLLTKSVAINFCNKWWWSTLLYVGNYVNPGELCFGHSWYLMVDMQLYLASPIVLYPLWRCRKYAKTMIATILLIASSSVVFVFVTMMLQGFRVSAMSESYLLKDSMIYTATHGRIDSWMMGILVGFVMHCAEGKSIKVTKLAVALWWTLSIFTFLVVTFVQYPLHQEGFNNNALAADAAYESLKRVLWCLAWAWVILACHFSYSGFVKRFLSHPAWLPISRLSFCIYLIHVPVMLVFLSSIRAPQFFSNFRAIHKFFGHFGVSFVVAFAWALLFEYPTLNILSLLMARR
jgi:peptidoglycan/LPS O-acetylase OafA/YrhL